MCHGYVEVCGSRQDGPAIGGESASDFWDERGMSHDRRPMFVGQYGSEVRACWPLRVSPLPLLSKARKGCVMRISTLGDSG